VSLHGRLPTAAILHPVTAFRRVAVNQVTKLTSQPNDRLRFIAPDQRRLLEKNHRRLLMAVMESFS
jgi:hypothetical protein